MCAINKLYFWKTPFINPNVSAFADTDRILDMLRDVNKKVNKLMDSRQPVWVPAKDIDLLRGKTRSELEYFREHNKGLWKNVGSDKKPSYLYDKNAFQL